MGIPFGPRNFGFYPTRQINYTHIQNNFYGGGGCYHPCPGGMYNFNNWFAPLPMYYTDYSRLNFDYTLGATFGTLAGLQIGHNLDSGRGPFQNRSPEEKTRALEERYERQAIRREHLQELRDDVADAQRQRAEDAKAARKKENEKFLANNPDLIDLTNDDEATIVHYKDPNTGKYYIYDKENETITPNRAENRKTDAIRKHGLKQVSGEFWWSTTEKCYYVYNGDGDFDRDKHIKEIDADGNPVPKNRKDPATDPFE